MQGKRLFYFGDFSRYSPGGAGRRLYTPPVTLAHSSAPGQAAHHKRHQNQGGQVPGQTARPKAGHAAPGCTRYQTGRAGQIVPAAERWRARSCSIMRIVIALSQAWYIDSNMNKYHKDILLFLVIANYYLSIDI